MSKNEKKEYEVLHPIAHGGRIERGDTIMLTESQAKNFGSHYVVEAGKAPTEEEEVQEDLELDEMSHAQLKEKAVELGLARSGSKAEILERIELHLESSDEEEEEGEEEEEK